ncbi:glycosyltransferase family 4 protein [Maribacter algarum]|uniref:Glycosyltransferase family 4 protein n=1 Tax=Maribacter algarum (ex Zhang et al. 2020) TaxID=2578118 RepID=A0A5S3PRS4_9FLAO|nr:glycosyltransferase [Maribacter algarum]TMM57361.1 glycosyltransferase family 4 protein [Maribacter algarum]
MTKKHLLIIALVWPEPSSTAAGNRMLQLIQYFLRKNYQITMASTAIESELSIDLDTLGIQKASIQLNHSSFDEFVTQLNPEVVLFDRFLTEEQFGWRVAEFAPNALRILDTEDLHSLRQTREKCFKNSIPFSTDAWLNEGITKREISSIYRSDISLIISLYEMYLLKDVLRMDESILIYLPFLLDPISKEEEQTWNSFENRVDFSCVGNGKHAPNVDAIVWLKSEIWPLIRKQLPKANLKIYGAYLPERIRQMHTENEGFLVKGWAENVNEVFNQARVNLAPLRFGAGLKGKLIDAMQNGTPSVTTSVGAEGMHGDLDFNGQIAETSENIAASAIELYKNQSLWEEAQTNGFEIINTLYDKSVWIEKLDAKIGSVQKDLETHRKNNFVGAILGHQTMASTKYMSKWIEEKNI